MNSSALPKLSYCLCGDQAIFLDVDGDRYFTLPGSLNREFRMGVDGVPSEARALTVSRLLDDAAPCAAICSPRDGPAPVVGATAKPGHIARVIIAHAAAVIRLKRRGFAAALQLSANRQASVRPQSSSQGYEAIAAAFHMLMPMIGRAENCLPRSIAFHDLAMGAGFTPSLVIGVKRDPFAAHAWVQDDGVVLNDSAEHVRIFTPILVI